MTTIFSHAHIVDVISGISYGPADIRVKDGIITQIGSMQPEGDDTVIDMKERYVSPGLFNCHTHICFKFFTDPMYATKNIVEATLNAVENLKVYIRTGVTCIRDVGDIEFLTVFVREAIRRGGLTDAPDLFTTGRPICMTGGSTWQLLGYQADGVDECRKAARLMLRNRIDWLKLMATGGVATRGNSCGAVQLNEDELRVMVEEAHKAGTPVSCHAQGLEGAKNAIRAGVDSLDHGFVLDDEAVQMMLDRGIWLVPTLMAPQESLKHCKLMIDDEFLKKAEKNTVDSIASFTRAYKAGVKCALGTDSGTILCPHDNTCEELILMVQACGVTPEDALRIGTIHSADMMRLKDSLGSIETGKKAHFAVYNEDPLKHITTLRDCRMTIKNGRVLWDAEA